MTLPEGSSQRRLTQLPLLRRDSMGPSYHVLTFDGARRSVAFPGQFAMVRGAAWGQAPLLPRPMSLLEPDGALRSSSKSSARGRRRLAHASPGEPFDLLLPLGNRWSPCPPGHTPLLVAGGVGIAPLLFFARELAAAGQSSITLYGGRSARRSAPPRRAGTGLRGASRPRTARAAPAAGHRAPRADARDAERADRRSTPAVPTAMMAAVAAHLPEARGVLCEASLETPMACGYGVCLGCPVPTLARRLPLRVHRGPCVDARDVAWEQSEAPMSADPSVTRSGRSP